MGARNDGERTRTIFIKTPPNNASSTLYAKKSLAVRKYQRSLDSMIKIPPFFTVISAAFLTISFETAN